MRTEVPSDLSPFMTPFGYSTGSMFALLRYAELVTSIPGFRANPHHCLYPKGVHPEKDQLAMKAAPG